jgi:hypothetical protein
MLVPGMLLLLAAHVYRKSLALAGHSAAALQLAAAQLLLPLVQLPTDLLVAASAPLELRAALLPAVLLLPLLHRLLLLCQLRAVQHPLLCLQHPLLLTAYLQVRSASYH